MDDEKKINKEQLEAIRHGEGPLLIIAGAGTGKTTVITERIKYLILKKNILPSEILALTFTDKAAREMEERVDIALPYGYTQMWISTFHAFCDRVLRNEAVHIGLDPGYKLMTEAETILFLRQNLFKFDLNYFRPLGNPNKFIEGMLQHFSRLKDEDVSPEVYLEYVHNLNKRLQLQKARKKTEGTEMTREEIEKTLELTQAYKTYEELKVKGGVMDFADLISNTLKLFRSRPNVLRQYQEQFKYILVDEFQDTNIAQYALLKILAPPKKRPNLTVVGDDSQSIYKFRGAAVSNILQFMEEYKGAKQVVLTKNYRSTQTILDHAYRLIKHNDPDTLEAKLGISKNLKKMRQVPEEKIEFLWTNRVENEADLGVQKIKELTNQPSAISHKPYAFSDIGILVRANNHADPFIRALSRAGIPYQFLGPGQLFRQEEVKDLIAYLKVLYNFEDNVSLYRLLSLDYFSIPPRDLAAILNFSRRKNLFLFEAIERIGEIFVSEKTKEIIKQIVGMINRHLKLLSKETAGQILYYFLEETGIFKKIIEYKSQREERKAQNISKFFDKLKTYEVEHEDATVPAVIDWIDLSMQMGESPLAADIDWTENNAVNILTVHSSKGLEFEIVFLVNLVAGRFPTRERREQIPIPEELIKEILPVGDYHLEEERRLFYVGVTRARDRLFLTAANYYGEGKRERKISPFVLEALGNKAIKQSSNLAIEEKQLSFFDWQKAPEAQIQTPVTKIDYLSYSQIETFETCPLHYKAKYLLKLQVPQTASQSFGTSLHAALREFYQKLLNKEKIKKEALFESLKRHWVTEGYQNRRHEEIAFKRGVRILTDYLKNHFDRKTLPLSLELPFQFKVAPNLKIGGKVDRIDKLTNGRIEILDYKTGENIPDFRRLEKSLQLTIYALAATEVVEPPLGKRKPEEVVLSLQFLENGQKLTTVRTKEQLEIAKEELLRKAAEISRSDFRCRGGSLCEKCEYKMLCGIP